MNRPAGGSFTPAHPIGRALDLGVPTTYQGGQLTCSSSVRKGPGKREVGKEGSEREPQEPAQMHVSRVVARILGSGTGMLLPLSP
ncbi:unnamed protein product [Sphagnum compactum]